MRPIHIIFYILVFSVLTSCGGGNSDNSNITVVKQTVLEGAWQSLCLQATNDYEISKNTFTNENSVSTVNVYTDSACQNNIITTTVKGPFSVGGSKTIGTGETVNDLDIIFQSATIILKTSATVSFFNSDPNFNCNGTKTYILNQETDVSNCKFMTDKVTIGAKQYAIFFIDKNTLYSSRFSDSNTLRPIAIDYSPTNIVKRL